jgi:hypothetical protein
LQKHRAQTAPHPWCAPTKSATVPAVSVTDTTSTHSARLRSACAIPHR